MSKRRCLNLTTRVPSCAAVRPAGGSTFRLHKNVFAASHHGARAGSVNNSWPTEKPQSREKSPRWAAGRIPSRCQTVSFQEEREETRSSGTNATASAVPLLIRVPVAAADSGSISALLHRDQAQNR